MKPLNLDNSPCSPISSNCVIWQGPNIPCIHLCTGDTVSDVVYKLAVELCGILDTLNVSNYDLACLNLNSCAPSDFQQLIQLLISKICELENIPTNPGTPSSGPCPNDCMVTVEYCLGGGMDTLTNYVNRIATKICDLVNQITVIQSQITSINITISDLQDQINNIPTYTLPDIPVPVGCTIGIYTGPTNVALDTLFEAFLQDWCLYIGTMGTGAEIAAVLNPACSLSGSAYFGADITSEPGWINPPATLADAISNIWTSLCFLYNFNYAQTVVTGSGDITVTSSYDAITNTTTYDVNLLTFIPSGAVMPWASPSPAAPLGWLLCDGSYKNAVDYPDLFTAIGTTYGSLGPGTFRLPDLQNRIPVGKGTNADGIDLSTVGNTGGNRVETLTDDQLPPHTHDLSGSSVTGTTSSAGAHNHEIWADPNDTAASGAINLTGNTGSWYDTGTNDTPPGTYVKTAGAHTHTISGSLTGNTGDGSPALQGNAHPNMQPYVVMQYIIKY